MTFSPTYAGDAALVYHSPVVPRKHIYVRKAGYSRYRVRRFSPPRLFPFCDKGIVGSECACRVFSTGECRVVPRVLRPDLPDPDVFLFSKRRKTNRLHKTAPPPCSPKNYIPHSLPVEGGSHREPLANDLHRERTNPNWCAIGLAQTPPISIPLIKVLLELERTSSFSKATVPLVPLVSPVPPVPHSPPRNNI